MARKPKMQNPNSISQLRKEHDSLVRDREKYRVKLKEADEKIKDLDIKIKNYEKIQAKINELYKQQDMLFSQDSQDEKNQESNLGGNVATEYVKNMGVEHEEKNYDYDRSL